VAVSVALAAAAVAGAMLLSWSGPPVATPATLAAALADAAGEPSGPRVVRLAPGRYDGPLRLGIAQREVRLVAIGAGVRIVSAQGPAIIAEPGLTGAEIVGIELVSESASPAVEVAGGAQLILRRLKAGSRGQFALRVAGGTLDLLEVGVDGGVRVGELGRLGLTGGSVRGLVEIEQASCQVEHGAISGGMTVRQGQLSVDGLELGAPSGIPALVLDGARVGVLAAVRLSSSVAGLVGRQAELPLIRGLAIRSQGPAIDWLGPRDPAWRWEGLDLEGSPAPVGLPAATP
jgi:hypothetical protein